MSKRDLALDAAPRGTPGYGQKMRTHGMNPRYFHLRREAEVRVARSERQNGRQRPQGERAAPTTRAHCPACGKGLSARYREPGSMHLVRGNAKEVCRWTP